MRRFAAVMPILAACAWFARGVNSFQLVKVDGRWMVQTILWEE